jgi:hypothetical protein
VTASAEDSDWKKESKFTFRQPENPSDVHKGIGFET